MSLNTPLYRSEKRVDPNDEQEYTFEEMQDYWVARRHKTPKEVEDYWNDECVPTGHPQIVGVPIWLPGEALPRWAFDTAAAADIEEREEDKRIHGKNRKFFALRTIEAAMVPIWKYTVWAVTLLWTFWAVAPFVSYARAACAPPGLAIVPNSLLVSYLPVLMISMALEFQGHRLLSPALARHLPADTVMGIKVPFVVWFGFRLFVSTCSHMDLATNGIFVGRLARSLYCSDTDIADIRTLLTLGTAVWIMMGGQLVVGLLYSIPCYSNEATEQRTEQFKYATGCEMMCISSQEIDIRLATHISVLNPSDAVLSLAKVGRMGLLGARPSSIMNASRGPRLSKSAETRQNWALNLQKDALLTSFQVLAESTTMSVLQAMVLASVKAAGGGIDMFTFASVLLTLYIMCLNWMMAANQQIHGRRAWKRHFGRHDRWVLRDKERAEQHVIFDEIGKHAVRRAVWIFGSACITSLVLSFYAGLKVFMDAFLCDGDSVWAFGGCSHLA